MFLSLFLEYLLANSCSTDDDEQIKKGMDNVKKILSEHYVNPEVKFSYSFKNKRAWKI